MLAPLIVFGLLTACSVEVYDPGVDTALLDDTGATAVDDTGEAAQASGSGGSGNQPDPDRPVVEAADAWCYLHQTGDQRWIWAATATASDPQGTATLALMSTKGITIFEGDALVSSQALVCDTAGECTASWGADVASMDCSRTEDYTLVFTVLDEDAKHSAPFEVTGRLGSGPEG